jgi:hypothetical protein
MKKLLMALLAAGLCNATQAGIIGESALLDTAGEAKLASWLGQGTLTLTTLFQKKPGSDSYSWHYASDNKGPTFTLMSASLDGVNWKTVGGYLPVSWGFGSVWGGFTMSEPEQRTAFLFNLTDNVVRHQRSDYLSYNAHGRGPSFGAFDLDVSGDLNTGSGDTFTFYDTEAELGTSLLTGAKFDPDAPYESHFFQIRDLEVFAVQAGGVPLPEPGTLAVTAFGLAGIAALRRKARKS